MLKKLFWGVVFISIGALSLRMMTWLPDPYPSPPLPTNEVPVFNILGINFAHEYDKTHSLPFMGGAAFDMKGNGQQYLFLSGGYNQPDRLYKYNHDSLIDITEGSGLTKDPNDTTYGVAAIDAHDHGFIDLFIARQSGLYLYKNINGKFEGKKLDVPLGPNEIPTSIAVADLKKRGKVDLFICTSPKNGHKQDYTNGAKSLLLLNNGDNTFEDITHEAGLEGSFNAYQAIFADINDRGEFDLIVTQTTGKISIYKNMGNLKFQLTPSPLENALSHPMGIAIGDYNNDGRPDLFFSNIGPSYWWNIGATPPDFMARMNLKKDQPLHRSHILLRNDGNFQFTDVARQAEVADYEFASSAIFADFNNNGYLDIALAQNNIDFPPHKLFKLHGRFLLQQPDHSFVATEKQAGVENPYFATSPLVVDLTNNGYPDLIYLNVDGPTRVFLNKGNGNNYIKVTLKNEPHSLGAKVVVKTKSGKTMTGFFIPNQGLCTSQTNTLFFGLGTENDLESVHIKYMDATHRHFDSPQINHELRVTP